jgi:hypothetical protein
MLYSALYSTKTGEWVEYSDTDTRYSITVPNIFTKEATIKKINEYRKSIGFKPLCSDIDICYFDIPTPAPQTPNQSPCP